MTSEGHALNESNIFKNYSQNVCQRCDPLVLVIERVFAQGFYKLTKMTPGQQ